MDGKKETTGFQPPDIILTPKVGYSAYGTLK